MFVDIISYSLAKDITEDALEAAAKDILEIWMKKQHGFLGWDINKTDDGFVDFVYWQDKAAADKATSAMKDIPVDHKWLQCYDMKTIKSQRAQNFFSYKSN